MNASSTTVRSSDNSAEKTVVVIGFGRRLAATLLDGAIVVILTFVLSVVATFVPLLIGWLIPIPVNIAILVVGVLFSVIYYVGSWSKSGRTIGKSALGIKVVGKDGSPLSVGKALLRYIGYIVSGIVASIGFLWIAFDRSRQGWHDKIAGSYVIRDQDRFSDADAVRFVPSDPQRSWLWVVLWIVVAIGMPAALFGSLWALGPFMSRLVTSFVR